MWQTATLDKTEGVWTVSPTDESGDLSYLGSLTEFYAGAAQADTAFAWINERGKLLVETAHAQNRLTFPRHSIPLREMQLLWRTPEGAHAELLGQPPQLEPGLEFSDYKKVTTRLRPERPGTSTIRIVPDE